MKLILLVTFLLLLFPATHLVNKLSKKQKFMSGKITKVLLVIYLFSLIISSIAVYFVPIEKEVHNDQKTVGELDDKVIHIDEKTEDEFDQWYTDFYNKLSTGKVDNIEGIKRNKQWTFVLQSNELQISSSSYEPFGGPFIWIEEVETEGNEIEVFHYVTEHFAYNYRFTDYIQAPTIQFSNDTVVAQFEHVNVKIAKFYKEFTINQFTGESMFDERHYYNFLGEDILYLKVPSNVRITSDSDIQLQYVEK